MCARAVSVSHDTDPDEHMHFLTYYVLLLILCTRYLTDRAHHINRGSLHRERSTDNCTCMNGIPITINMGNRSDLSDVFCTRYFMGWFKHKTLNSFRCQCPRRFFAFDPEILHTYSYVFSVLMKKFQGRGNF